MGTLAFRYSIRGPSLNVHPGVEHDFFLIASRYQRSANSDSELIEVKEYSLFVGGPISLLYGDKPHSMAYPRVGSVLPFPSTSSWSFLPSLPSRTGDYWMVSTEARRRESHGEKIASRGAKNAKKRAAVAVACKLLVLLHCLWVSAEVYEPLYNVHRRAEQQAAWRGSRIMEQRSYTEEVKIPQEHRAATLKSKGVHSMVDRQNHDSEMSSSTPSKKRLWRSSRRASGVS